MEGKTMSYKTEATVFLLQLAKGANSSRVQRIDFLEFVSFVTFPDDLIPLAKDA